MPYARLEVPRDWPDELKRSLAPAVDAALVEVFGVPPRDCFVRLFEYDRTHALVPAVHGPHFVYVEIQLFPGRSVETKRRLYRTLVQRLDGLGIPPADVTIALNEIPLQNWGLRGGRSADQCDSDFRPES